MVSYALGFVLEKGQFETGSTAFIYSRKRENDVDDGGRNKVEVRVFSRRLFCSLSSSKSAFSKPDFLSSFSLSPLFKWTFLEAAGRPPRASPLLWQHRCPAVWRGGRSSHEEKLATMKGEMSA